MATETKNNSFYIFRKNIRKNYEHQYCTGFEYFLGAFGSYHVLKKVNREYLIIAIGNICLQALNEFSLFRSYILIILSKYSSKQ
jgi:hypothetical protein